MIKGKIGPFLFLYLLLANEQLVEELDLWGEVLKVGEELYKTVFLLLLPLLFLLFILLFLHFIYPALL